MDKIFEKANDQHVRNYVIYGKSDDHKLYYESAYKTQITDTDLEAIFKKGAVLIYDGENYLVPIEFAGHTVKTIDTSSTLAAVSWTAATSE